MPQKIETGEPKNLKKGLKTAALFATGLAMGSTDAGLTERQVRPETQTIKPIEQNAGINYAQKEQQRIEEKYGKSIVVPEKKQEKQRAERNYEEDFDIGAGIKCGDEYDFHKTVAVLGKLNIPALELSGDRYSHLDNDGTNYKHGAFAQMVAKYGEKRFQEFSNFLQSIYLSEEKKSPEEILRVYGGSLRSIKGDPDKKKYVNKQLYNIADALEPGGLEKLADLFSILRKDGYDKNYDFAWSPEIIDKMLSDGEERKALIILATKYQHSKGGPNVMKRLRVRDQIGHETFDFMLPVEKLKAVESAVDAEKK